jgi:chorismate-pyruvate lyase
VSSSSLYLPDLGDLVELFYPSLPECGELTPAEGESIPAAYRLLLAHTAHMTVTLEAYHRSLVDVHVWERQVTPTHYARKITLTRQSDGAVVMFGIMRVNLTVLDPEVQERIVGEGTPLGRILIEHDILRRIRTPRLWRVLPGPDLTACMGLDSPRVTYGRTAMMNLNEAPAVELLEIVTPLS